MWSQLLRKLKRSAQIFKYTSFTYYRPAQICNKEIEYSVNRSKVRISGNSVWSMIEEIIISDSYHLKAQKNPAVIFDIGANVGIFSLHAATLFPSCKIYAFEPSPDNFKLLQKNTAPFPNIMCVNMALSNYQGLGFISNDKDNTAYKVSAHSEDESKNCLVTTLESFLQEQQLNSIDILKLDCEGAEYEILSGNLKNIKEIVGEYHVVGAHNGDNIKSILKQKGFSLKEFKEFFNKQAGLFWAINNMINQDAFLLEKNIN